MLFLGKLLLDNNSLKYKLDLVKISLCSNNNNKLIGQVNPFKINNKIKLLGQQHNLVNNQLINRCLELLVKINKIKTISNNKTHFQEVKINNHNNNNNRLLTLCGVQDKIHSNNKFPKEQECLDKINHNNYNKILSILEDLDNKLFNSNRVLFKIINLILIINLIY